VLLAKGEKQAALDLVKRAIFDRGHDGIEPRLMAAKVELGRGKYGLARRHLERGSELDESEVEVWALLARVAQAQKDADLELAALRGWALRAEHDGDVHRRYVGRLLDAGLLDEARLATKNAIWADLGSATTHALAARVYLRLGETKAARFEWESAQLCPMSSRERERLTTEVADAFAAAGSSTEAREIRSTLPAASADGSQSSEPPPATAPP
jgi:Tfp pilus assembly protein PilF